MGYNMDREGGRDEKGGILGYKEKMVWMGWCAIGFRNGGFRRKVELRDSIKGGDFVWEWDWR